MTIIRISRYPFEIVLLIILIIIILSSWKFVRYYRLSAKDLKSKSKETIFVLHFGCTVILSCLTFIWLRGLDFSESIVNDYEWIVPLSLVALLGIYGLIIGKVIDFFVVGRSDKRN
ncbi:MAG: hypothetical protein LBV72_17350 [Tannerella sp.]|jgi:Trk-type K+ transport system membrane component|nr:hypothetical protein [Tannerella sp.]